MADDKVKKTLYHSELVGMSPVTVDIMSEPTKSTFKGRPEYVQMRIDGNIRNYNVENNDCLETLKGMKGRKVAIEASGSRDEAIIKIVSSSLPKESAEEKAEPKPEPKPEPKQEQKTDTKPQSAGVPMENFQEQRKAANRVGNMYLLAFDTALYCKEQIKSLHGIDIPVTSDDFRAIVNTIVIRMGYDGDHKFMPTGVYTDLKKRASQK